MFIGNKSHSPFLHPQQNQCARILYFLLQMSVWVVLYPPDEQHSPILSNQPLRKALFGSKNYMKLNTHKFQHCTKYLLSQLQPELFQMYIVWF